MDVFKRVKKEFNEIFISEWMLEDALWNERHPTEIKTIFLL